MPKRKHEEYAEHTPHTSTIDDDNNERKLNVQATRLRRHFEQGSQVLFRALKTARGFERQKLGRRQKTALATAKESGHGDEEAHKKTMERLNAEVQVLKTLDLSTTAEKYLFKQLARTKRIAESPPFARLQNAVKITLTGPQDIAEANVTARLFRSNPVKNALPGIMDGIRELLGLDDVKDQRRQHHPKEDSRKRTLEQNDTPVKRSLIPSEEVDVSQIRVENLSMDDTGSAPGHVDNDDISIDYSKFKDRLASSSEDDDDDDDNDSEDEKLQKARRRVKSRHNPSLSVSASPSLSSSPPPSDAESDPVSIPSLSASQSASASESESLSLRPSKTQSQPTSTSKTKSLSKMPSTTKATTFLPSLMMGGYWSGSESDDNGPAPDLSDPDTQHGSGKAQRKNRRGQRARQAIWEKKYGTKAKHLSKEKKQQKTGSNMLQMSRDRGWDLRKGATDENDNARQKGKPWVRGAHRDRVHENKAGAGREGAPDTRTSLDTRGKRSNKSDNADKPLHPSWEAARKAKEQKAQASFQGKKITFD